MTGARNGSAAVSPVASPDPVVVHGLTKRFGERAVIENIALSARRGEFVAVLGPSGAGKTTLFRCIGGLTPVDAGHVQVGGVDITNRHGRERRRMAMVFQQFNLVARLSAVDNVLAGRLGHAPAWRGWLRRFEHADRLIAYECLERVGLLDAAEQRADTLSGGQKQRVAIARALAQRPEVIVADEPVASLDPKISEEILRLLRSVCASDGVAVLCSLHQVHYATAFADRIVGLAHGRIVIDTPIAAFDQRAIEHIYGHRSGDSADPVGDERPAEVPARLSLHTP
jgi:phosphonate transport system ATP-binding protein